MTFIKLYHNYSVFPYEINTRRDVIFPFEIFKKNFPYLQTCKLYNHIGKISHAEELENANIVLKN